MTHVFITGATGLVGGATVSRLLGDDRVREIFALVRGDALTTARDRVRQAVSRFGALENCVGSQLLVTPPSQNIVTPAGTAIAVNPPRGQGRR